MPFIQFLKHGLALNRAYSPDDVAELPKEICDRMIKDGTARECSPDEATRKSLESPTTEPNPVPNTNPPKGNPQNPPPTETDSDLALFDFLTDEQVESLNAAELSSPGKIFAALTAEDDLTKLKHIGKATVEKFRTVLKMD